MAAVSGNEGQEKPAYTQGDHKSNRSRIQPRGWRREGAALGWLLLGPAFLLIIVTVIYPMGYSLVISFFDWTLTSGDPSFVGLENYLTIVHDPHFWHAVGTSLRYTFWTVLLELFFGLTLALLLNRTIRGIGVLRTLLTMPFVVTPVVAALIWRWLYNPDFGFVTWLLKSLGVARPDLLGNPATALGAVVAVDVAQATPFMFVILLAGLQAIPKELYEAAAVDGANQVQNFFLVTIPGLKPVLLVALLLRTMDAIKGVDKVYILTGGGPGTATEILPMHVLENAFHYFHVGYGSALAYTLTFLVLIISLGYMWVLRTND